MENPTKSITELIVVEELAEEILRDKSEVVALDKRRNSNREGMRLLMKTTFKKTWMTVGPLLVRIPCEKAQDLLQKDQNTIDFELNKLRSELKVKVNKLQDLEYKDPIPGLNLKPLDKTEMSAFGQVLGRSS